jgi:hypothetical protein
MMRAGIDMTLDDDGNRSITDRWISWLQSNPVDHTGIIVEVGPGFTTKIARALLADGFRGTLFLVEPNESALAWSTRRYREMLTRCDVEPVNLPIAAASRALPHHVDALIMNHLLDDLVLRAAARPDRRDGLFAGMRAGAPCSTEVRRIWDRLAGDPIMFASVGERVVEDVCGFRSAVDPSVTFITQYVSWVHAHERLEFVDRLTAPLLQTLAARLAPCADIEVADDGRWLAACRSTSTLTAAEMHAPAVGDRYGA